MLFFFSLAFTKIGLVRNYVTFSPINSRFSGVRTYLNLDNKKALLSDNKGKPGIYRFVNLLNGKTNVGSSVDLSRRLFFTRLVKKGAPKK